MSEELLKSSKAMQYNKIDNSRSESEEPAIDLDDPFDFSLKETEEQWMIENKERFRKLPWYRKPSRPLLYSVLALHAFSFTVLFGPLVLLMLESICQYDPTEGQSSGMGMRDVGRFLMMVKRMDMGGGTPDQGSDCKNPNSQQVLSNIQSFLSLISGLLGFFVSGKLGQMSDIRGRVYVLRMLGLLNSFQTLCMIAYFVWYGGYNKFLMVLVCSIGHFGGGIMTLISTGNSYLTDIVTDEERTISISWMMSCVYLMLGLGPLIGSAAVKISDGDNKVVLYISFLTGLASLILMFTMAETRHPEAMISAHQEIANKSGAVMYHENKIVNAALSLYYSFISFFKPMKRLWLERSPSGSLVPRINVLTLIFVDLANMAATAGTMSVITLYTVLQFKWTSVEIGYYMSISGFGRAGVLLLVAPLFLKTLQKVFHMEQKSDSLDKMDKACIVSSLVFVFLSSLLLIVWDSSTAVYLSALLQSLSGMVSPTIQGSIIKYSSKTTSGEMFGAMALVRHLAMLILPVTFLQIYSHTVDFWPKFFMYIPFVGSILTLVVSVIFLKEHHELYY